MIEEERKYDVEVGFQLPTLKPALPRGSTVTALPPTTLRATYYDTPTLRLARAGISIRYRSGERGKPPWTVKLPTRGGAESRDEITRPGSARAVPAELVTLLTAYHRGAELAPAVTIRTQRRAYEVRDRDGELLVEVADDTVSVVDGRRVVSQFREIEVERKGGNGKLLDRIEDELLDAGACRGTFRPKHARALGERATLPPDLVPPAFSKSSRVSAGDIVVTALRKHIERIFQADPYLRLRTSMPDGETPVHQMRVGCRRLRSDLRTFRPLLDPTWADNLRAGASWLATVLGAARDAEVLRERLHRTAGADPVAPLDPAAVARFDAELAARHEDALQQLEDVLAADRYATMLDVLVEAARDPQLGPAAREPAAQALTRLVARPWRQLTVAARGRVAAGELDPLGADEDWHSVRIRAKRARYAVESVAKLIGGEAAALGEALTEVQELLGEHQDATVAADTWLSIALSDVDDHAVAVAAGRLVERERAAVRTVRSRFPAAWAVIGAGTNTRWLSP